MLGCSTGTLSPEGRLELTGPDGTPPSEEQLQGPAIWSARMDGDLVASWRVYEDTEHSRVLLGVAHPSGNGEDIG